MISSLQNSLFFDAQQMYGNVVFGFQREFENSALAHFGEQIRCVADVSL